MFVVTVVSPQFSKYKYVLLEMQSMRNCDRVLEPRYPVVTDNKVS